MATEYSIKKIATIYTDFNEKFGIPRQGGLIEELKGEIVFEPEFRNPDTLRGLEEYSHIWLLWIFSENIRDGWSATVRPPRLGGNVRKGVFATRAPFRPSPIGMSAVRLEKIIDDPKRGPVLIVSGADLLSGTPIADIKPYIPYADSIPDAAAGLSALPWKQSLSVIDDTGLLPTSEAVQDVQSESGEDPAETEAAAETKALASAGKKPSPAAACAIANSSPNGGSAVYFPPEKAAALRKILALDPRPSYQEDPERIYGFGFAGFEIHFRVEAAELHIVEISKK